MSRSYTLADAAAVLRAADDDYHDGIDAIVDIHPQPARRAGTAELLIELTPPGHTPAARATSAQRFQVTVTVDPATGHQHHDQGQAAPTADRPAGLLDGCADHTVAAARAAHVIGDRHGAWAPPARRLLAVLLQAAALDRRGPDQVKAWADDLTPAVAEHLHTILTRPHIARVPLTSRDQATGRRRTHPVTVQESVLLPYRSTHARARDSVTATITAALTALGPVGATVGGAR
jgi:hypothetical protein